MKLEHIFSQYTKINSKWLKDLNQRPDTIKLLEEIIGKAFSDINCTNIFLGQSPKAIEVKNQQQKRWDLNELAIFSIAKKTINKQTKKTNYRMGESICKWCSQRDLNFQNKQTAHTTQQEKKQKPNLKKVEDLNRYFSKKENKGLTRA